MLDAMRILKKIQENDISENKINFQFALDKFNRLIRLFDCIAELNRQADSLIKRKKTEAYDAANQLINSLVKEITAYLKQPKHDLNNSKLTIEDYKNYNTFKKHCLQLINTAKNLPLKKHRGCKRILGNIVLAIIGAGVGYVIAGCLNKALTGNFLFFNKTRSIKKVEKTDKALPKTLGLYRRQTKQKK